MRGQERVNREGKPSDDAFQFGHLRKFSRNILVTYRFMGRNSGPFKYVYLYNKIVHRRAMGAQPADHDCDTLTAPKNWLPVTYGIIFDYSKSLLAMLIHHLKIPSSTYCLLTEGRFFWCCIVCTLAKTNPLSPMCHKKLQIEKAVNLRCLYI